MQAAQSMRSVHAAGAGHLIACLRDTPADAETVVFGAGARPGRRETCRARVARLNCRFVRPHSVHGGAHCTAMRGAIERYP